MSSWLLFCLTSNHRLRGIPMPCHNLKVQPTYSDAFPNGESNFAVVGGVKVYDQEG